MKTYIAAILVSVVTASCAAQAFAANQEPHSVKEHAEYTHNKIENAKEAGVLGGREAHKMQKEVKRIDKKAANLKDHDKLDRQQYQKLSNELRHENKKLSKIERKSRMN
jgi:hypothetical protein